MQKTFPFMAELGLKPDVVNKGVYRRGEWVGAGPVDKSFDPHDNQLIGQTATATVAQYNECIVAMEEERQKWVSTPMPIRGEIVR